MEKQMRQLTIRAYIVCASCWVFTGCQNDPNPKIAAYIKSEKYDSAFSVATNAKIDPCDYAKYMVQLHSHIEAADSLAVSALNKQSTCRMAFDSIQILKSEAYAHLAFSPTQNDSALTSQYFHKSLNAANLCLDKFPYNKMCHYNKIEALYNLELGDQALESAGKLLQKWPNDFHGIALFASAQFATKDYSGSISTFKKVLDNCKVIIDSTKETCNNSLRLSAGAYYLSGNTNQAIQLVKQSLLYDSDDDQSMHELAKMYFEIGLRDSGCVYARNAASHGDKYSIGIVKSKCNK